MARNALEAQAILEHKNPGLLIVDIKMPGKSGAALIKELISKGIRIPMIIMTAYSNIFTSLDAEAAGAKGYFQKPFDIEEMNDLVKKLLRSSQDHGHAQKRPAEGSGNCHHSHRDDTGRDV